MDLRRQIAIVRGWLPLLIVFVVGAASVAFVFSNMQARIYEAKATLIVGQSLSAANPNYDQLLASQRLSTTYASVVTTRPILERVVEELDLTTTADELRTRVIADTPQSNTLLTITVRDTDPGRAAEVANALADELVAVSPAIQGREAEFQASIDEDLKATQEQIRTTQARIQALADLPVRTPEQDQELGTLEGRLVTLRSIYATLLSYSSGGSNLLSIVEPAVEPTTPVAPRPLLYTALAAVVGLLLGAALVFVIEYLDDSIKSPDDVQEVVQLATLGSIARMKGDRGQSEIYRLVTLLYPRSVAAEGYRTLRTNIEFASVDAPIRTLLVASSVPDEGKTVTAANLATVFAQAGHRVLLVDADLRKPGAHLIFNLPNTQGLTTLLRSEEVTVEAVAHTTEQANLWVLTTGPLPPNPAELLGSLRMRKVVDRLKAGVDLVILDGPPLQAVTDSAILSAMVDGTLFVVDAGRSRRGAARQGREALARAGANVIGAVLNRAPALARPDYGDYFENIDAAGAPGPGTESAPEKPAA